MLTASNPSVTASKLGALPLRGYASGPGASGPSKFVYPTFMTLPTGVFRMRRKKSMVSMTGK